MVIDSNSQNCYDVFIQLFNQYSLSDFYVPDTLLGSGNEQTSLPLGHLFSSVEDRQ